jgi:OmpA-OmpF porin, OOP family
MTTRSRLFAPLFGLPLVCFARLASADSASGFAIDRFEPAERGSSWFVLDSLDLRGHRRYSAGDSTEFAYKPLVLYNADGSERAPVVKLQAFTHIGASLVMWDRARFGFNLPLLFWQQGDAGSIGSTTYSSSNSATIGDLRLGADLALFGTHGDALTGAIGLQLFVPTGDRNAYTGDGKARLLPHLLIAGEAKQFTYAAHLGFNYRAHNDPFASIPMGSEVVFGLSGGVRALGKTFLIGPELYGRTGVSSSDALFNKRTTPLEVLLGVHYRIATDVHIGVGAGPGLSRGLGSPQMRVLASIEWNPAYEPVSPLPAADRDQDGVTDLEDACPQVPGVRGYDRATNGCPPPPPDRDGDGVVDSEDGCPLQAGTATQDPKTNGCPLPPPDRDADGVIDAEDACPDTSGVATQDPKTNGCPAPPSDRDGDGIIDSDDGCPDHAGPKDPDPKKNGCPVARLEAGQIKISQQVKFATASAQLLPESDAVLQAVLEVLQGHPDIKKISVEGHTDNQGADAANRDLSRRRAAAVATWLASRGIDRKRISSEGLGTTRPIDTNDTESGRQNNRRVEFHVMDSAAPAATPTPPAASSAPPAPAVAPVPNSSVAPPAAPQSCTVIGTQMGQDGIRRAVFGPPGCQRGPNGP